MARVEEQAAEQASGVERGFAKLCSVLRADRQLKRAASEETERAAQTREAEARRRVAQARKGEIRRHFARLIPGRRVYEVVGTLNIIVRYQLFRPGTFLTATPDEVATFLERGSIVEIPSKRQAPPPTPAA